MSQLPNLQREWVLKEEPAEVPCCAESQELHPVLRQLLGQRGFIEDVCVQKFLNPKLRDLSDPFALPEMAQAVDRVLQAIDSGEEICIYGDYDVDGISSITVLARVLKAYGASVRPFIPIRSQEGYGLSEEALARCLSEGAKPGLLIAVDCGTVSHEPIQFLSDEGIDVVVVDHHEKSHLGRPPCVALVNPKFSHTQFEYLCAAGVTFKLAHALLRTRPLADFDLKKLLELVALATIADIVPLVDENRLLVRQGLKRLPASESPGLQALMKVTGLNGFTTSSDVGFRLGPRINAAGRMDRPQEALETLLTESLSSATELAERLNDYNRLRQKTELQILDEAEAMLADDPGFYDAPSIVLGSRSWHPGVVGIVASRLMRKYHRPCFIIAFNDEGIGKGSGRSIEGVSLVEGIQANEELLIAGGGHHMAAGISLEEEALPAFRDGFAQHVREKISAKTLKPHLLIDAELDIGALDLEFLHQYEQLQPFGSGNPTPVFVAREVWPTDTPRALKNGHFKFWLRQGMSEKDAIFFGAGEREFPEPPWDIAFTIDRNCFRGNTSCQMLIRDIRAASSDTLSNRS